MKASIMGLTRIKFESQIHHQNMQQKKIPVFAEDNQRFMWDNQQRRINILINNVNSSNITNIVQELLSLNLFKGRGLFCRAILDSLDSSQTSAPVLAALVAAINVEFPDVGYLLLKRIVVQLKTACKRKDKVQILNTVKLVAHLVNQSVVLGSFAFDLLMFLLQDPTNEYSVEASVSLLTECGYALQDLIPFRLDCIFECLGTILEDGHISKELQRRINWLFIMKRDKFKGCPDIPQELDIVNLDDQVTHEISFYYEVDPELSLDVFSPE